MQRIGPGTVIASRYAVSHRIQQHPRWERWSALDTPTGRSVVILTFPGDTPAAAAAVDAARRAAGVSDPRLVRILDVLPQQDGDGASGAAVVVEEPVDRAQTLTKILGQGGLPGDEARRITGETAVALEAAAARGLRHIVLTPRNVLLMPDGSVRVRGVAVEAALLGLEDTPAALASRLDARALAAVGYAALTGRWPLSGPDSGLPSAPAVGGVVVSPDELAADVCPDLDRLARIILIEGAGPTTPADVRAMLRPWPSTPTIDLTGDRSGGQSSGTASGRAVAAGAGTAMLDPTERLPVIAAEARSSPSSASVNPVVGQEFSSAGPTSTGVGANAGRAGQGSTGASAVAGAGAGAAMAAAAGRAARGLSSALTSAGTATAGAASRVAQRARHTAERVAGRPSEDSAGTAVGTAAGTAVGSAAGSVGDPSARTPSARPSLRPQRPPDFYLQDTTLTSVLAGDQASLEDPVPLVPSPGEMGRGESRLALFIVAGLVLLLAVLGLWGLPKLSVSAPSTKPAPSSTATATKATGTAPGATASVAPPSAAVAGPVAVPIAGGALFDANTGQAPSSTAGRAFDGKTDTMWRSGWYASEKFGGLKVAGIGLVLDLGQQTEVRQVTTTLPVAQDLTVYVANRASLDGATTIGASSGRSGQIVFDVPAGPVASGQLVIVFFTKLGPDGSGRFRAQVSEVSVSR